MTDSQDTQEEGGTAPDLSPLADRLAAAIRRRHAVGNEAPAQIAAAAELDAIAAEQERSRSYVMAQAVREFIAPRRGATAINAKENAK